VKEFGKIVKLELDEPNFRLSKVKDMLDNLFIIENHRKFVNLIETDLGRGEINVGSLTVSSKANFKVHGLCIKTFGCVHDCDLE
jgi:hypothetical protein